MTVTELAPDLAPRILQEGYGPGAWHGNDLKAAIADVTASTAFWRPAKGRHNIAEIALHHAWCARAVRGKLTGQPLGAFEAEGEDWFVLEEAGPLAWSKVQKVVAREQERLAEAVAAGPTPVELVLGITCHAVYHAGQIQLLKVLRG